MNVVLFLLLGVGGLFICYGLISLYTFFRHPQNNPKAYVQRLSALSGGPRRRLVVVGNSLTHGTVSGNYVDLLSERLNREECLVDVINAGINGDHAFHVLQRVDDIVRCRPDVITILIGTNDAVDSVDMNATFSFWWHKLPQPSTLAFFRTSLITLVNRLKSETDATIALLSLPPIGEDLRHPMALVSHTFSRAIHEIAEQLSVEYLPLHEAMQAYLHEHPAQPKYTFEKQNRVFMTSLFKRMLGYPSQQISKDLGFHLHIDFLHLNGRGASMIADVIEAFFKTHI